MTSGSYSGEPQHYLVVKPPIPKQNGQLGGISWDPNNFRLDGVGSEMKSWNTAQPIVGS